ncbi:MAG: hypothetical protein IT437_12105 [Phycisphaerales bacterium]|nr:hypothetical protein [Phycisphaerales bacterium]
MIPSATESARAARAARRRLVFADFVKLAGLLLLWGCGIAGALVLGDRLGLVLAPWPFLVPAPLVIAVMVAGIAALLRRPSLVESAVRLDRALGLRDRVSTALVLQGTDPFGLWALAEGERAARHANPAKVVAVRMDWTWGAWPVAAAACIGVAVLAPRAHWGRRIPAPVSMAERMSAAERLAAAAGSARSAVESATIAEASRDDLAAIADLEAELRGGHGDPEQAVARASERLDSMAGVFEDRAEHSQRTADAVRDRLVAAGAGRPATRDPGPAGALDEALARGDLGAAATAAKDLAESADQLSAAEQLDLAQDLESLARSLQERDAEPPDAPGRSERQALEDQGVPPGAAEQLAREPDPERIREELGKQGVAPDAARRAADQVSKSRQNRDAQRDAREQVGDLRDALRDAAESLRKPRQPGAQEQGPRPREERDAGGEKPRDSGGPEPTESSGEKGAREAPGSSEQSSQDRGARERPGGVPPGPKRQSGPEPGKGDQGQQPKDNGSPEQGASGTPDSTGKHEGPRPETPTHDAKPEGGEPRSGDGRSGEIANPDERNASEDPGAAPSKPSTEPGQKGEERGDGPGQKPGGLDRLQRQIREMARGREAPREMGQRARRLRDAARDLIRGPGRGSDQDPSWGRGAGSSGEPGVPPPIPSRPVLAGDDPVDARHGPLGGTTPKERVIAEWYSPDRADPAGTAVSGMQTDLRAAVRGAERAVEQQSVPARHSDLVRRVFRRYAERAAPGPP